MGAYSDGEMQERCRTGEMQDGEMQDDGEMQERCRTDEVTPKTPAAFDDAG
jgi:hypothetical protein